MEPPVRRRFKAPAVFQPSPQSAPQRKRTEIEAGFRGYQVQFVDRLRQANGVDLAKARVQSPANRWIRLDLGAGIRAHDRPRTPAPVAGAASDRAARLSKGMTPT